MLRPDTGARVGGRVNEHLVVTHVVRETMEENRLITYIVERRLDLRPAHVRMIAHPGSVDEWFWPGQWTHSRRVGRRASYARARAQNTPDLGATVTQHGVGRWRAYRRLHARSPRASPSLSVMPSLGATRCRPSTRGSAAGLAVAVARGARRCCCQAAPAPAGL